MTENRKEEREYLELERLGKKLGIPIPMVFLSLEVRKHGRIFSKYRERSRTWNRNFWNASICTLTRSPGVATNFGAGYLSFKTTAGAVNAIVSGSLIFTPDSAVGVATGGIQVGTGAGAESFEGYALGTLIAHGNSATQLYYQAHSALTQSYNAPTKVWTITIKRILNNNSGGTITVNEVALTWISNVPSNIMWNRDLLGAGVAVANGAQLTVSYNITLTFPA